VAPLSAPEMVMTSAPVLPTMVSTVATVMVVGVDKVKVVTGVCLSRARQRAHGAPQLEQRATGGHTHEAYGSTQALVDKGGRVGRPLAGPAPAFPRFGSDGR
jgi:hypothetical protein